MKEFDYKGNAMVNGAALKGYMAAFGPYMQRGEQILCKYFGVSEISGNGEVFYPLSQYLKALEEFQRQFGVDFIKKVGAWITRSAVVSQETEEKLGEEFVSEIREGGSQGKVKNKMGDDALGVLLPIMNNLYYLNHKAEPGEIGGFNWHSDGPRSGLLVIDNPYPCCFDKGLMEAMIRNVAPKGKAIHLEDKPCRHKGGDSCTYKVEW